MDVSNYYKVAEPIPHRSAHQGSHSGFGMAGREGCGFESGRHVEEDTILHLRIASRCQTAHAEYNAHTTACCSESRTSTPPEISVTACVRPEESAPLVSRATNPGGRLPAGRKQIASILKTPHRSSGMFTILRTSGADPSPLGSPRLALGIRDGRSRGWGIRVRTQRRGGHDLASPHRLALTNSLRRTQRPHNDMLFREPNINTT